MMSFCEKTVEIVNLRGLHARAAARFVKTAELHQACVTVFKDDMAVGGLSIMGLLMLAAAKNSRIRISAEGDGAEEALNALVELVECGFGEDA
jgi:phosphocarrier protein